MNRIIATRVTTRDVLDTIIFESEKQDTRARFTRDLYPTFRVKIVGVVMGVSIIDKEEEDKFYANISLSDPYGVVKVFIPISALAEKVRKEILPGDVVQVVGRIFENELPNGEKRNEIVADGVAKVDKSIFVYHLVKYAEERKKHLEYLNLFKRITELRNEYNELKSKSKDASSIERLSLLRRKINALEMGLPQKYKLMNSIIEEYIEYLLEIQTPFEELLSDEDEDEYVKL